MERRREPWPETDGRQRREAPWDLGQPRQRRRPQWGQFRQAYPRIVTAMALGVAGLVGLDAWLLYKHVTYRRQIARLRGQMTEADRRRADAIVAANENRARLMVELVRRDAGLEDDLNLAVALEDGVLYLQREGARLREMRVRLGPEREVGTPPDTVKLALPRGKFSVARVVDESYAWEVPAWVYAERGLPVPAERRVAGGLGPVAILLTGGTVIYSDPRQGPLQDGGYVLPGAVRASPADLQAIVENLSPGIPVYFY